MSFAFVGVLFLDLSRRLAGGMDDWSYTVDRRDLPPQPVLQYIERYGAWFNSSLFAAMRLAGDTKTICYVRSELMGDAAESTWIKSLLVQLFGWRILPITGSRNDGS